jgi:hypothetical protein
MKTTERLLDDVSPVARVGTPAHMKESRAAFAAPEPLEIL